MRVPVSLERRTFATRQSAGRLLAQRLAWMVDQADRCRVLAIPPGGVLVAEPIAVRLDAPLDVVVVNDLVLPSSRLAVKVGAVTAGADVLADTSELAAYHVAGWLPPHLAGLVRTEVLRLERFYHGGGRPAEPRGQTAVIVDDGLASSYSLRAAAAAELAAGAARVIVASPLIAEPVIDRLVEMGVHVASLLQDDRERTGLDSWLYPEERIPREHEAMEVLARCRRRVPSSWS